MKRGCELASVAAARRRLQVIENRCYNTTTTRPETTRFGIALPVEHGYWRSPQGQQAYQAQLQCLRLQQKKAGPFGPEALTQREIDERQFAICVRKHATWNVKWPLVDQDCT
jgi:hypothetical protein